MKYYTYTLKEVKMIKTQVICIGSATLDNFLTVNQPLSKIKLGDKLLVKSMEKHSGGGATNAAAALSKLGIKTKLLSKLGSDHDAEFILKELKQYKIKNLCLHHSRKNTDFSTIISSTKERDRIIYVHKGASEDLNKHDYKKSQLKTEWIYLSSLMNKSFQTIKEIIQHTDAKILFNPSSYLAKKGIAYLGSVLNKTNILILNKEEALALLKTKSKNIKTVLLNLHKLGPNKIIITNGAKRIYAYYHGIIYSLTPPNVEVIHTAGSGDAFAASFLAATIKDYSFEDALRLGQINANSVIQHLGTKNKLLTEKEARPYFKKYNIKVRKE
jgi:ribokinase